MHTTCYNLTMINIQDWRAPIAEMYIEKQKLAAVDSAGIFPMFQPALAASETAIEALEKALNIQLNDEHRSFLTYADGWNCFYQNVTLFSTDELASGSLRDAAYQAFEHTPEVLEDLGLSTENLLPIAASLEQADVFVMLVENGVVKPEVLWIAEGEVIDKYQTFGEYFMSMIEYTKRRTAKIQGA